VWHTPGGASFISLPVMPGGVSCPETQTLRDAVFLSVDGHLPNGDSFCRFRPGSRLPAARVGSSFPGPSPMLLQALDSRGREACGLTPAEFGSILLRWAQRLITASHPAFSRFQPEDSLFPRAGINSELALLMPRTRTRIAWERFLHNIALPSSTLR